MFRLHRQRSREPSLEATPAAETIPTREPGPEELAIIADMMDWMLRPLPELTPNQQALFVRRFVENARVVDLQEETGRNAHALRTALYTISRRMRRMLDGQGVDAAEVADLLSLIDRSRGSG